MRLRHVVWLFIGAYVLAAPALVQAGLYNPCEMDEGPYVIDYYNPDTRQGFQKTLFKLRSYAQKVAVDSPARERYILVGESLAGNTELSTVQKLSLSEYMIRRGKVLDAWGLLRKISNEPGENFLILSNMATACHLLAEEQKDPAEKSVKYSDAITYLGESLKLWPEDWSKLPEGQRRLLEGMHWVPEVTFPRCRNAEKYYLKLLRNRRSEAKLKVPETVDPLFTSDSDPPQPVRYIAETGVFEPGKLAAAELAKLPDKKVDSALQIVQQLLVWLPHDDRLYWQLGELYSARGQPQDLHAAWKIFDDLKTTRKANGMPPIKEALARWEVLKQFENAPDSGRVLPSEVVANKLDKVEKDTRSPIDWRLLGTGFGAGFLVAILAHWQIREFRRRRTP